MKNLNVFFLGICLLGLQQLGFAQIDPTAFGYYAEALRFSRTINGGTVRFQTLGGANTALGGDISSAHVNPAGLGFNRSSQFSLTPSVNVNNSTANALFSAGSTLQDTRLNVNFDNIGIVFSGAKNSTGPNKGGSFAITLTRINDFQQNMAYRGINAENSIVDFFLEQSDGRLSWGYFDDQGDNIFDINALAYYTYLINPDYEFDNGGQNLFFSFLPLVNTEVSELVQTRGGQYQWDFAYGGNYDDRLYYGISLGLQTIRFDQTKEYSEIPLEDSPLSSLVFTDRLTVNGTGVNLTGGLIYRFNDAVRLGVSATTPTAIRLSEIYYADLDANYNGFVFRPADYIDDPALQDAFRDEAVVLNREAYSTIDMEASYTLLTPFRASAGLSVFAGKMGFITADVEYVGYQNARFTGGMQSGISFEGDNNTIKNIYKGTYNLKIGGELRLNKFRVRAGGAYYDDPFSERNQTIDRSILALSAGVGVYDQKYFLDFGIVNMTGDETYSPYSLSNGTTPNIAIANNRTRAMISFGVFF